MIKPARDLGGLISVHDACSSENSGAPSVITAAGALDNVKVTGQTINRVRSDGAIADSAVLTTAVLAALADTETVSLAHELQESSDGSSWDTAEVIEALTIKATSSGGTNERVADEHSIDLRSRKQYIRFNVTLDLSRGATDTATFHSTAALGGYDKVAQ